MKVVLCGSDEQIAEYKKRLKQNVVIIGSIRLYVDELSVEERQYDLVGTGIQQGAIFLVSDETQSNTLIKIGVDSSNILLCCIFDQTNFYNPIGAFNDKNWYTGLLFGMSHSQCAIDIRCLTDNMYYKVSAPSMDIFCHLHFLEKMCLDYPSEMMKIQSIVVELPYYIFNYDLSRFGKFVYTKLNYYEILGNYHHLGETEEQREMIIKFKLYWNIFYRETFPKNAPIDKPLLIPLKRIYYSIKAATKKEKVWSTLYKYTIAENRDLWHEFVDLAERCCPNARINVLVMPFNPAFRLTHKEQISKSRDCFYECIQDTRITVLDEFDYVKDVRLFQDHCHLNACGGQKYSDHLALVLETVTK